MNGPKQQDRGGNRLKVQVVCNVLDNSMLYVNWVVYEMFIIL
jgi:hypothetical protein